MIALVVMAPRRTVGDGGEYLSYALSFARGEGPAMTQASFREIVAEIQVDDPAFGAADLESRGRTRADGQIEFLHFWLYSAMAAPAVAIARMIGVDPRHGFAVFNVALLVWAFFLMCRRFGAPLAFFLAAGPILWWADKAHPEVMLFSLTVAAFSLWNSWPVLALLCTGLLGAQVPPYGVLIPLFAVAIWFADRRAADRDAIDRSRRASARRAGHRAEARWLLLAGVGAVVIAVSAPLHYLYHFGRPSLLAGENAEPWTWPTMGEITTPLGDLNVGLFPNHPLLALALAAALIAVVRDWRRLLRLDLGIALVAIGVLLTAFPQIHNWTHGGTPGVNRFAVWLIPFALPLLAAPAVSATWTRIMSLLAAGSVLYGAAYYAPSVEQLAYRSEPTWIARQVWRHAPTWSRPLPVVFAGIVKPNKATLPIAAPGCGKVLIVGRGEAQGMWPRPCPPAPVPAECREPGKFCWANRTADGYAFEVITEEAPRAPFNPESVWPREAEAGIRAAIEKIGWAALGEFRPPDRAGAIRRLNGAALEDGLSGDGRLFLVLQGVQPSAVIALTDRPGETIWLDAATGAIIESAAGDVETAGAWTLAIPQRPRVVLAVAPVR